MLNAQARQSSRNEQRCASIATTIAWMPRPTTSDRRRALGAAGEQAAAEMLVALGYEIVERNFRTRYGELDIVASDGESLVFCEVRSRVGNEALAWGVQSI